MSGRPVSLAALLGLSAAALWCTGCPATRKMNSALEGTMTLLPCAGVSNHPPLVFPALERRRWLETTPLRREQVTRQDVRSAKVTGITLTPSTSGGLAGISSMEVFVEVDTETIPVDGGTGFNGARVLVARSRARGQADQPMAFDLTGADLSGMVGELLSVSTTVTVTGCPPMQTDLKLALDVELEVDGQPLRRLSTEPKAP